MSLPAYRWHPHAAFEEAIKLPLLNLTSCYLLPFYWFETLLLGRFVAPIFLHQLGEVIFK